MFQSVYVCVVTQCEKFQEDTSGRKLSVRLFVSFEVISNVCNVLNATMIRFASFVFDWMATESTFLLVYFTCHAG